MEFLNYLQQNNLKRLIKPMCFHIVHTNVLKNLRFYKLFEARRVEIIKKFHRFCFKKLRIFMISGIKKIKKIKKNKRFPPRGHPCWALEARCDFGAFWLVRLYQCFLLQEKLRYIYICIYLYTYIYIYVYIRMSESCG